jgi:ubiquinone biosynthesis protein
MLNPQFNFVKHSQRYVSQYTRKKALTAESFRLFLARSREIGEVLEMIPSEVLGVLEKLRTGIIKIDIDDTDLKRLALDIDKSSNRLSYSLIVAALIIGGALLMHANAGPYYRGLSFPAMVLYIIAAFMGLMLLASILKEGTLWR